MNVNQTNGQAVGAPTYRLVGRIKGADGLTYYQVLGLQDCGLYNINRETMMEATRRGMVMNVRTQGYNGVEILRGVGVNINELRPINANKYKVARQRGRTVAQALADARAPMTEAQRMAAQQRAAKAQAQTQATTRNQQMGYPAGYGRGQGVYGR